MPDTQPELPGLGTIRPDADRLEKAARALLEQLREKGLIQAEHVLLEQIILDLSRAVGISAQSGKAAGMAMAAKELREYLALLPKANDDAFQQLLDELNSDSKKPAL